MAAELIAVPSRGRLREPTMDLLQRAGFRPGVDRVRSEHESPLFIEMRPRDAAAWLHADRIGAAFVSTDLIDEWDLSYLDSLPLGVARSDLIVAVRNNDRRVKVTDLAGATIATHLPRATARWLERQGTEARIVEMGGSLEGVCAAGLADAIVDLRQTGASLANHGLRTLATLRSCEATLAWSPTASDAVLDLVERLRAVLEAMNRRYVVLHAPTEMVDAVVESLTGLASPTISPLSRHTDTVAVHVVLRPDELWSLRPRLLELGCSGIVAMQPEAIILSPHEDASKGEDQHA